jgi:hypothetical protein
MVGFFLSFSLLFTGLTSSAHAGYSLADLEVLTAEGGHDEFFKHALDVRPSERQDAWKSMVIKMGDVFTRSVLKRKDISPQNFQKTELLYRWPVLKADDVFKSRRQEIGLTFLKSCLKESSPCWKELKDFWETDSTDPDTAFKLAELISQFPDSPTKTWSYLQVALKSPLSEFYCQKDFALNALWKKFEIDYIRLGSRGDLLSKIDETIHPDCLPHLNKLAMERLMRPNSQDDRELAYQLLKAQGKASQKLTDFFFTVYLLENPSKGELFNYSWNRLKELGKASSRRDEVYQIIKNLDPLPDTLLASLDLPKKRAILNHFKLHFPEYFQHYAQQCLSFYGGTGIFPKGNPTMNCQNLMESDLGRSYYGREMINDFTKIRKI